MLLDLNLPRLDGREVLKQLSEHEVWRLVPVIVLTSSQAETDLVECYKRHANAVIQKPVDLDALIEIVRKLRDFWFTVVRLPPKDLA